MPIQFLSDTDHNGARVTNLGTPTAANDAATKAFVEGLYANLAWKDAVRVASIANITVATPGASHDGVTFAVNDRILLKDQAAPPENGIYNFNGAAVPLTRASDFDATSELEAARIPVEEGTSNAGTTWILTTQNPVIGSALAFANILGGVPNATTTVPGSTQLATQPQVDAGTASPAYLVVTPATLNAWSGRKLKISQTIGDGVATQYDVTHNFGTLDVHVQVERVSDGSFVNVETKAFSTNVVRLNFAVAALLNGYRVTVIG